MQQQQEWERKKACLIRSLFVDLPPLSPVPEEDSPSQISTRPYSPLPDLIIERVKPINKHDEPEEFYQELERKMKKLYRKLFLNDDANSMDEADELLRHYGYRNDSGEEFSIDRDYGKLVGDSASMDRSSVILDRGKVSEGRGSVTDGDSDTVGQDMARSDHEIDQDASRMDQSLGRMAQDSVSMDQSVMYQDSSSQETNGVRIITCEAQIHRVESDEGSVEEEEPPSFVVEPVRSRAVTKRGEFIDIRISALEGIGGGDSNENGENRGSIPVITLDSSESASNNSLEINRNYNIRRNSMGSIRLLDSHGRLSSSSNVTFTRSRSLDPELEAYDRTAMSDIKLTEDFHADSPKHAPGEEFEMWTDLDTETSGSEVSEEIASGVAASTPKSTQERSKSKSLSKAESPSQFKSPSLVTNPPGFQRSTFKSRSKSKSSSKDDSTSKSLSLSVASEDEEVDKLNTAVITKSLTFSSDDDEIHELDSARYSFPSDVGVKRRSADRSESGGEKRKRIPMEEISWNELKNNFFVGIPTVYRLCSCDDHICNH